jgi:hypothetical protein
MVQDAVQGHHWSSDQVTLHPIVIYTHQSESPTKPRPISLCVASDCMEYVTSTFYDFQTVIQYIKTLENNTRIKRHCISVREKILPIQYIIRTVLELLQ